MSFYKTVIRPILFYFDPEKVHYFTFFVIKNAFKIPGIAYLIKTYYCVNDARLERNLFGITFKNPVGLAAGFDKNAVLYNDLAHFGFGFIEIGTVTPLAQPGNVKKRLFRLPKDAAIINRMGFNNAGVEAAIFQLKLKKTPIIIGGNIGKNTQTTPENYTADYLYGFNALHPYVDYFVLNVSCPNVSSHAKLNDKDYLIELIMAVNQANLKFEKQKPILLKIAPDLNTVQLDEIVDLVMQTKIAGVIVSNTSVQREGLQTAPHILEHIGNGGLSGKPIKAVSTAAIQYIATKSNKAFSLIGVGGIHSADDALEKLNAGADLIQLYTGFIYEGPSLIKAINKAILKFK